MASLPTVALLLGPEPVAPIPTLSYSFPAPIPISLFFVRGPLRQPWRSWATFCPGTSWLFRRLQARGGRGRARRAQRATHTKSETFPRWHRRPGPGSAAPPRRRGARDSGECRSTAERPGRKAGHSAERFCEARKQCFLRMRGVSRVTSSRSGDARLGPGKAKKPGR